MHQKLRRFRLQALLVCLCMTMQIFLPIQVSGTETANNGIMSPTNELETT